MKTCIVIGGGIAGCSTAHFLARRGIKVTLLERESQLAQGASGNDVAMLYPKLAVTPNASCLLGLKGFQFSLDLLQTLDASAQFHARCGQIQLAFDAKTQSQQDKIATQAYFSSINAHTVTANEASKVAGITLEQGGIYLPDGAWVMPRAWCAALARHANIEIVLETTALRLEKLENNWRVHAKKQVYTGDCVVVCNAADLADFMPHLRANISRVHGQVNAFVVTETSANLRSIVCGEQFISPAVEGKHHFGASYHIPNHAQATQANLRGLAAIAPQLARDLRAENLCSRTGWRCATQDYLPLAGQLLDVAMLQQFPPRPSAKPHTLPWLTGLYINAGHGSKGMLSAPLCAHWLASDIAGEPTQNPLFSSMQPNRFVLRAMGLKALAQRIYG